MNREILDHLLAAATVYLTLHAAERFGWRRALPLGAVLGLGILGNVRLEALPLVLCAYLLWRTGVSRRTVLATGALFAGAAVVVHAVGRAEQGERRLLDGDDRRTRALEGEQRQHVRDAEARRLDRPRAAAEVVPADAAGRLRALAEDRRRACRTTSARR